jgi:serine/threonine protein kinase
MTTLRFRRATTGETEVTEAEAEDTEFRAGECLMGRLVKLDDGTELRQHRVPVGDLRDKDKGYERLDNEIYAGRMLHEVAGWFGYPAEVACLYGDEATSAEPYALFERYRGEPLRNAVDYLDPTDWEAFEVSLVTGLCWLAAAGIAHRALSPDTVLWDNDQRQVQITDFSRSISFGANRVPVTGHAEWIAPELRAGRLYGMVGPRDDMWAAGRLIFFARNQGEDLRDRGQLAGSGLDVLLGRPEDRPTASELLQSRRHRDPAAGSEHDRTWLSEGRRRFLDLRAGKYPGAAVPADFYADITWGGGSDGGDPPGRPPGPPPGPPPGDPPGGVRPLSDPPAGPPSGEAKYPEAEQRPSRPRRWGRGG